MENIKIYSISEKLNIFKYFIISFYKYDFKFNYLPPNFIINLYIKHLHNFILILKFN